MLGETILEKEWQARFDLIEGVRKASVKLHLENDQATTLLLEQLLQNLTPVQKISVLPAFSYFQHLVNIAEDLYAHEITRLNEDNLTPSLLDFSVASLVYQAVTFQTVEQFFKDVLVLPVLTAHPSEVKLKSILEAGQQLSALIAKRGGLISKKELAHNELLIRGAISTLRQTRILRFSKLTVLNEIENVLSYYQASFLDLIPEILQNLDHDLKAHYKKM